MLAWWHSSNSYDSSLIFLSKAKLSMAPCLMLSDWVWISAVVSLVGLMMG
jgi:hypothetical protein